MGEMLNQGAAASNYGLQAAELRLQGSAARSKAFADARRLEADALAGLEVAAEDMMTLRRNESVAMAAERAARGNSGFVVSAGSQLAGELSVAEVFEKRVGDLRRSASVGAGNAYRQAAQLRRDGDNALAAAEVSARAMDAFARRSRRVATWMGVGSGLGTVGSVLSTYSLSSGMEEFGKGASGKGASGSEK